MGRLLNPLTPDAVQPLVQAAFDAARERTPTDTPENLLTPLLLCVQERNAIFANEPHMVGVIDRVAANRVLAGALKAFELQDGDGYTILHEYYFEGKSDSKIAAQINYSRQAVNRMRPESIKAFAKVVCEREAYARRRQTNQLLTSLPSAPYNLFFGRNQATKSLTTQLTSDDALGIVSIIGIGGMGKTALAHHVVRQAIPSLEFDKIIWLTVQSASQQAADLPPTITFDSLIGSLAQRLDDTAFGNGLDIQQRLHYVGERLRTTPHLIIIDNIELEADVIYILNRIQQLAGRSKFLVTSRIQPYVPYVYSYSLKPLSVDESVQLLNSHMRRSAPMRPEQMKALAKSVSGHPLALQLAANQTGPHTELPRLDELKASDEDGFNKLLARLYAQKWMQVSDTTRTLWVTLSLMTNEAAVETHLQHASGLGKRDFYSAINQLLAFSLLDVRNALDGTVTYIYHPLTPAFAREQVAKAAPDSAEDDYDTRAAFVQAVGHNIIWWEQETATAFLLRRFQQCEMDLHRAIRFGLDFSETSEAATLLLLNLFISIDNNDTSKLWLPLFEKALSAETNAPPLKRFKLLRRTGWFSWQINRYEQADIWMREAEQLAQDVLNDDLFTSQSDFGLAWLAFSQHQYDEAKRRAKRALRLRRELQLGAATRQPLLYLLGMIASEQGNADGALDYFERAVALAVGLDSDLALLSNYNELVLVHGMLGDVPKAESYCEQVLELIDRTGRESMRVLVLVRMASVYNDHAQYELAHRMLISAENTASQRPFTQRERALAAMEWGRLHLAREDFATAQHHLEPVLDTWRLLQNNVNLGQTMFFLSLALRGLKKPVDANHLHQDAIAMLQQHRDAYRAQKLLGKTD